MMEYYAGLDVSLRSCAICIVDNKGKVLFERELACEVRVRGNLHDGQAVIDDLVMDLDDIETQYASIKALRKAASEFQTYIANNAWMIPNYAERRRYSASVSTGFVESTVNTVVGKRFYKRQQMRWSKTGAHLMLQTRTRTLDGTLLAKFQQWYPGMKSDREAEMAT